MRTAASLITVALLVAFFWRQGERVLEANGPTFDEGAHLTAGYAYWKTGDFALNAEHPPLLKLWWALPLVLGDAPPYPHGVAAESNNDHWKIATAFLYNSGVSHLSLITPARRMNLVLGCGIVLLAGWWSYRLWGNRLAGVAAAGFAAFDPNLLALACVLSTDCGFALFALLSCYLMWEYVRPGSAAVPAASRTTPERKEDLANSHLAVTRGRDGRGPRLLLYATGVSIGLMLGTKLSAIAMVGGIGVAGLLFIRRGGVLALPGRTGSFDFAFRLGVIAFITLAATYGFIHFDEWGRGLKFQLTRGTHGDGRLYLNGELSKTGWFHYFFVVLALKLPLGLIAASVSSLPLVFSKRESRLVYLLVPPLIFFLAVSVSRVDLGVRVILPATVFLYVIAAALVRKPACAVFAYGCIVWSALGAFGTYPIAYFNELAGDRGYVHIADSNADWGQGLPALRDENLDVVYLSYFGTDRPEAYGIRYQALPGYGRVGPVGGEPILENAKRHVLAISVNNLLGIYLNESDTFAFLRDREPDRVLAGSILLFDLTNDPEAIRRVRAASVR